LGGGSLTDSALGLLLDFIMMRKYPVNITMSSDKRQLKKGDALHFYRFPKSFLISPSTPMTLNLLR